MGKGTGMGKGIYMGKGMGAAIGLCSRPYVLCLICSMSIFFTGAVVGQAYAIGSPLATNDTGISSALGGAGATKAAPLPVVTPIAVTPGTQPISNEAEIRRR